MSLLLRAAPRAFARSAPAARQQIRSMHVDNVVDHALPTSVQNKYWLGTKIVVYGVTGFGLPFYAAYWHISKNAAA